MFVLDEQRIAGNHSLLSLYGAIRNRGDAYTGFVKVLNIPRYGDDTI